MTDGPNHTPVPDLSRLDSGLPRTFGAASLLTLASFCVVGVLCLYGRALGYCPVQDDALLLRSGSVAALSTLPQALTHDLFWLAGDAVRPSPYWRPVVVASYYLDYAWGGGALWAYRLSNGLMLALLALLVGSKASTRVGAALAAGLVMAHPLQLETVINITARTDLMLALFGTIAVTRGGAVGAVATALALGSKETAVVVPVLALLRGRQDRAGPRSWVPHSVVVVAWLALRQGLVASWLVAPEDSGSPSLQGLRQLPATLSFYLGRLVLPLDPLPARALPDLGWPWTLAGLAVLFTLGWGLSRPSRGRSLAVCGLALPVLSLLPVSGLLSASVRYAEGFLCWPLVGLALLLGQAPRRAQAALGVVVAVLAVGTWSHLPVWRDETVLWHDAWRRLPGDPVIGLKLARARAGHPGSGDPWPPLRAALQAETDPRRTREAHALAASLLLGAGPKAKLPSSSEDAQAALGHLRLAALPGDPEAGWALSARCVLEAPDSAALPDLRSVCDAALERNSKDAALWNSAGIQAATHGDGARALVCFGRASALEPQSPSYSGNLRSAQVEYGAAAEGGP